MEDIGKSTVFVLLVLTILISVIGTWAVLSGVSSIEDQTIVSKDRGDKGNINLNVVEPAREKSQAQAGISLVLEGN